MADNNAHREKFEELCAGYVLHALDEEDRAEFERMLAEASDEERNLYRQMKSAANQLAFATEKSEPSEQLKGRIMSQIQSQDTDDYESGASDATDSISPVDKEDSPQDTKAGDQNGDGDEKEDEDEGFNWRAFAVAASFALMVVCLSLIFYTFNLSSAISEKEQVIASQEAQITELKTELRQKEEMLSILEAREVDMVLMSGLEVNPNGYGKIIWNSEKEQALLQVSNLPALPRDKDYQLWLIKDNTPINAGIFSVSGKDDKFFKIEEMADISERSANAFAVTMEPKGGMPQPTGDMYLMGKMR